ncbi:RRP15-like protein [Sitophilus oryzae]|uniref:RRP15-like protein n=1 Tax=Sitophilus oryzae TaxID=7048 RepID=A0A6J2YT38_SITOR|nr:RRP15-like protein [Sitophilus oryzae]
MTVKSQKAKVIVEDDVHSRSDSDSEVESNAESLENDSADNVSQSLNEAWADSIAKILNTNKPKGKKSLVLSKAKKLTDVKKTKTKVENFEIATSDGQFKREVTEEIVEEETIARKRRRELPNLRVKPNILEKDRERTLQKIATKGVVQLFNAVKLQQKDIGRKLDEAGPLEVHKDRVLKNIDKRAFLDVLMGEKSENVQKIAATNENTSNSKKPSWNVLRDDFMMSTKMKDWDKELEESEGEQNMEFD